MTETTAEKQSQTEQPEAAAPTKKSSRKSILALSVLALGINSTAAVYTMAPSDFTLPNMSSLADNISNLADLIPHQKASDPILDPAVAALKEIQSVQQQHVASLQENTVLLQEDSIALASLRQSVVDQHVDVKKISSQIADEHQDVKKISGQISALIAKVDSLKNAMTSEVTSSIPAKHLTRAERRKMARQPKPVGPVSLGGAPLSLPAATPSPES